MRARARIRDVVQHGGSETGKRHREPSQCHIDGMGELLRVGNSSRAFGKIRDYPERKIRTLLPRRKRRQKRSIGWRRWSNEYLYGVLGLYWDWKVHPPPKRRRISMKVSATSMGLITLLTKIMG